MELSVIVNYCMVYDRDMKLKRISESWRGSSKGTRTNLGDEGYVL